MQWKSAINLYRIGKDEWSSYLELAGGMHNCL